MKDLRARLDDILIAAETRTEENPDGDWSSSRVLLTFSIVCFEGFTIAYDGFRDAGAHVAVILTLAAGAYAGKIVDLRMAIGQAAAAIGRRWRKETTTIESEGGGTLGDVDIEAENVTVTENGPAAVEVVRTDVEQEP